VANPEDLLTFWRSKSRVPREKGGAGKGQDHDDLEIGGLLEAPEIPELVDEELTKGMGKEGLKVLFKSDIFDAITRHHPSLPTRACAHNLSCSGPPPRTELSAVLLPDTHIMCDHSFVDKEEKEAIVKMVQKSLKTVKDDFEKKQLHNCPPGELENAVHKDLKERQQQVARPPSHEHGDAPPLFSTESSLLHSRYQITSMLILFTQQAPSKAQNVKGTGKQTQLTFSQVHS
jgi:hypothetical protein